MRPRFTKRTTEHIPARRSNQGLAPPLTANPHQESAKGQQADTKFTSRLFTRLDRHSKKTILRGNRTFRACRGLSKQKMKTSGARFYSAIIKALGQRLRRLTGWAVGRVGQEMPCVHDLPSGKRTNTRETL